MHLDRISIEHSTRWTQDFLRREWQLALPIALTFFSLPSLAFGVIMSTLPKTPLPQTTADVVALVQGLPWWLTPVLLACTVVMLAGGLALIALASLPQVSVAEAIQTALRRLPAAIGAWLLLIGGWVIALMAAGLVGGLLRAPAVVSLAVLVLMIASIALQIYHLLLLPLIVDRKLGPIAAIRASRRFYRGGFLRLGGAILLYLIVTFVATLAIQITLGTMLIAAVGAAGSLEAGQIAAAVLGSVTSALQFGGLYLLTTAFYRQRVGRD